MGRTVFCGCYQCSSVWKTRFLGDGIMVRWQGAFFALVVAVLGLPPELACAQALYGVTQTAFPNNKLVTINTATGAGTVVGPISNTIDPCGLAFRSGHLYT